MTKTDVMNYCGALADSLDAAERINADCPGEGERYISISDTLAKSISGKLREIIGALFASSMPVEGVASDGNKRRE